MLTVHYSFFIINLYRRQIQGNRISQIKRVRLRYENRFLFILDKIRQKHYGKRIPVSIDLICGIALMIINIT